MQLTPNQRLENPEPKLYSCKNIPLNSLSNSRVTSTSGEKENRGGCVHSRKLTSLLPVIPVYPVLGRTLAKQAKAPCNWQRIHFY